MSAAWKVDKLDPDAPLALNARRILAVRIAEYYSWEPVIHDDARIDSLHDLRISAKRLRYTLELFRSVYGESGNRCIERLRGLQDLLGQLNDHDVGIALIEDELRTLAIEQASALNAALANADPASLPAIAASAFRPPPDDPRRGLVNLLSRQYASRITNVEEIRRLWRSQHVAGMRNELVCLSSMPAAPSEGNS